MTHHETPGSMKLTKTEQKLLDRIGSNGCAATYGKRENDAARKLGAKSLVDFINLSEYVSPRHSQKRNSIGDYVGYHVTQGVIHRVYKEGIAA